MFDFILDCLRTLRDWIVDKIQGVINFLKDVVSWFKRLKLDKNKDTPFIMKGEELRRMLHKAPVIKNTGIFEANYDEEADEITDSRELQADGLDRQTREALDSADDGLVVLS